MKIPIEIAKEVAEGVYSTPRIDVRDVILYGSVARESSNPEDIDLLVIHERRLPDIPEVGYKDERATVTQQLLRLFGFQNIDFSPPVDIQALSTDFFLDFNAFREYIRRGRDPLFYKDVFESGLLFDTLERKFNEPSSKKYQPAINVIQAYANLIVQFQLPTFLMYDIKTMDRMGGPSIIGKEISHFLYARIFTPYPQLPSPSSEK